jgi:tetratricopeptide (TPR) repeat protein
VDDVKHVGAALLVVLLASHAHVARADKVAARRAYDLGVKKYNLGEYEAALDAFTTAYNEYADPSLLFNLAQCHRQLGHKEKAITLYKSYLRESDEHAANTADVKRLIALLEKDLAREESTRQAPPTSTESPVTSEPAQNTAAPPATAERVQTSTTRTLKIAGVAVAAGGVALVAVGGAVFGLAKNANDAYLHPSDGTYSAAAESRRATYNALDKTFVIVGGVALAAGVTMLAIGVKKSGSWSFAPAVSTNHASLSLMTRF